MTQPFPPSPLEPAQPLPLTMPAHFAHPAVSFAGLRAELAREAAARRRTYPDWIAKGRMTAAEAEHQHQVLAAITADLEWSRAVPAVRVPYHAAPPEPVEGRRFTWPEKRTALKRELAQRARLYPDWIAKGRFTAAQGAAQIAALTAMLSMYDDGLAWTPSPADAGPDERRRQWAEIAAALAAQRGETQQELMM